MNKKIIHILLLLCCCSFTNAAGVAVRDTNFLAFLKQSFPSVINSNNDLDTVVASTITGQFVCTNQNIKYIDEIIFFKSISYIDFQHNQIDSIPQLNTIKELTYLNFNTNFLSVLPNLDKNKKLRDLILYANNLKYLPSLDSLINLQQLDVVGNQLLALPNLDNCIGLVKLFCNKNRISILPNLNKLVNIKALDASFNQISIFPDIKNCTNLLTLNVNDNLIYQLPTLPVLNALQKVFLWNNYLNFSQLNNVLVYSNYSSIFNTYPQYSTTTKNTFIKLRGDSLNYKTTQDSGVDGVYYSWFKNGQSYGVANPDVLSIKTLAFQDSGMYTCIVRSTFFPNNKITGDSIYLKVKECINVDSITITKSNISCNNYGNIKIDTKYKYNYTLLTTTNNDTIVSGSGIFKNLNNTQFILNIKHPNGCILDYGLIELDRDECTQVLITPNDDGDADEYFFIQTGQVKIYNKKGDLIKTLQTPAAWNASSKNGKVAQGFYLADINDGEKIIKISVIY